MRRLAIAFGVLVLLLAACGDSDSDETTAAPAATQAATTAAPTTAAATTTAPPTTAAPTTTTTTTTAAPVPDPPDAEPLDVELAEFSVAMPDELAAGTYEINLSNIGEFGHELVIVRADGYDSLAQEANGAVIESEIAPEDFILRIDKIDGNTSTTGQVTLEAGNYVFFCNIAVGPNSHAGAGQTLDVTVGG